MTSGQPVAAQVCVEEALPVCVEEDLPERDMELPDDDDLGPIVNDAIPVPKPAVAAKQMLLALCLFVYFLTYWICKKTTIGNIFVVIERP